MILTRDQLEAIETLDRELNHTITRPDEITLRREDASTLSSLIHELISENKSKNGQN